MHSLLLLAALDLVVEVLKDLPRRHHLLALSKQLVLDRHDVFDLFQDSKVHVFVVLAIVPVAGVPPHQVNRMNVHGQ